MSQTDGKISYGKETIAFKILPVRRKTLEIAVHPDGSVVVKAPIGTLHSEVQRRIQKRARWIKLQQSYFRQFDPRTTERLYKSGETHLYLGRQYRLKVTNGDHNDVRLSRGRFHIVVKGSTSQDKVRDLLETWYASKAACRFEISLDRNWPDFEKLQLPKPRLRIQRMHKRWGSLSRNGVLTLNLNLIRSTQSCIDYVIVHELCHLKHHNHSRDFYNLLGKIMPDWELRKHKLELSLA